MVVSRATMTRTARPLCLHSHPDVPSAFVDSVSLDFEVSDRAVLASRRSALPTSFLKSPSTSPAEGSPITSCGLTIKLVTLLHTWHASEPMIVAYTALSVVATQMFPPMATISRLSTVITPWRSLERAVQHQPGLVLSLYSTIGFSLQESQCWAS